MHANPLDGPLGAVGALDGDSVDVLPGTDTHCPYCALQCGMTLRPADGGGDGPVRPETGPEAGTGIRLEVAERPDFPVNRGALCGKGRTAPPNCSHRTPGSPSR
ncbi:hypothetical protein [Streptomyces marispadix]|uniref:hypothetical protein n=1 Tax=Streptomyces marispadix TaxID=2922868 RepID=UPI003557B7DE